MISYDDKSITFDGEEYKLKGLNSSHIAWHLSEIYNVKSFLDNLSESYSFPNKIHYMSIAEGEDFDALLVDDKMFRYKKLSESDLMQVQDCLNKYAYATALVKINECSEVLGSGLYHKFTMNEAYDYLSESYNRLLENFTQTNEKGKLLESYNNINIYEGNSTYIRGIGNSRYEECWEDTFKHENIKNYVVESVKGDNNNSIITFIDPNGIRLEATYKNTNSKLIESGINVINFLKKSNLVESYRVGKLNEYHQPFTMKYATITSYDWNGNQLILNVVDMFGNSGTMPVDIKIPKEEFMKKYKKKLDEITKVKTFKDGVNKTTELMRDAAEDWDRFNRISNLNVEERNSENQLLSYKVAPFIPKVGDEPTIKKLGKNKFTVNVTDDTDNDYTLTYLYKGVDDIDDFIDNITPEIDEYDFSNKSDVIEFYQLMDDYGDVERSYPKGKTNNNVRKVRLNVKESEGVQTTDIAPKLDQNVGTIKVTMKKKKDKLNTNDLLLNTINEQDEFYGARGFIKDEKGRYHFNDYYINESGKVVHKSKLNESSKDDVLNEFYNKFSDFLNKIGCTYKNVVGKYIRIINKNAPSGCDNFVCKIEIKEYMYRTKLVVRSVKDYFDETIRKETEWTDGSPNINRFLRDNFDVSVGYDWVEHTPKDYKKLYENYIKKEYNKQHKELDNFLYSISDLVDKEKMADKEDKKERDEFVQGSISIKYVPRVHERGWEGSLNLSQIKEHLKGINYRCEKEKDKYGSVYYMFYIDKNDADRVRQTYKNILVPNADVESWGLDESNLNEEFWNEDGVTEYKGVKISIEKSSKGNKCYIPLRSNKFIPERGTQFFKLKDAKNYIDSKLNESFSPKPEDWDDINHWYNDDPREEWDRLEKKDFIISIDGCQPVKYSPKDMCHEAAIEDYLDNEGAGHSRKEIKFEYLDENSNLIKKYVVTLKHDKGKVKINTTASSKEQAIKQVCNSEKAPESAVVKVEEYELNESFNPTEYDVEFNKLFDKFVKGTGVKKIDSLNKDERYRDGDVFYTKFMSDKGKETFAYSPYSGIGAATYNNKDINGDEKDVEINTLIKKYNDVSKGINESFNPTSYTKVIDAISAGIETDEDEEALQKYLQDIINYCRSIAEDYDVLVESNNDKKYTVSFRIVSKDKKVSYDFNSEDEMFDYLDLIASAIGSGEIDNLEYTGKGSKKETDTFTEGQKEADDAYYKVNDVALKLQEIKPLIKDNTEAEDLYTEIMIALNSLQMRLHDEKLNEDMTQSELLDKYKQAISYYLPKCKTREDLISVLHTYLTQLENEDDRWNELKEGSTFKQGDEEFFVQPYKYGDDSFNIKYKIHGTRHMSNEPYTVDGEYNFIYDEENKEVLTGMKKDGKVVPDNWGKMKNVSKDKWLDMVNNPKQDLIPWVQGDHLD